MIDKEKYITEMTEDPNLILCRREAKLGLISWLVYLILILGSAYVLGYNRVTDPLDFVFIFPTYIVVSGIILPLLFLGYVIWLVRSKTLVNFDFEKEAKDPTELL